MKAKQLIAAADQLRQDLRGLEFLEPVHTTYCPLEYAWERHCDYLRKCGSGPQKALFLGMNPGPWGMTQTGVPFGEIPHVREWIGIEGPVDKPSVEHPKRPVTGFACERSEVSGRRLWGLFKDLFGTSKQFFDHHFVANFCPLVWMSETGANIVPEKIPRPKIEPVEAVCLEHLQKVIDILDPEILIGVGAFAEKQLAKVNSQDRPVGKILHPSPASPAANRDFAGTATRQLRELGIISG